MTSDEFEALLREYGNAEFDCGRYPVLDSRLADIKYTELVDKVHRLRQQVLDAFNEEH